MQIKGQYWNGNPLKVITFAIVRSAIHSYNIDKLKSLHIHIPLMKQCMKNLHQIVTKYCTYLVLDKRKLNNNQALVLPLENNLSPKMYLLVFTKPMAHLPQGR